MNRIDRVVVFRPLNRGVVRDILLKELNDVLQRRGFRDRDWAVEWEESALDYLLDKGFTADLGARPLKRAIERYLLSPLSMTIVQNKFPVGDQFLFVRSTGKALAVEFIDPDATTEPVVPSKDSSPPKAEWEDVSSLKPLILDGIGTPAEVDHLESVYEMLCDEVESDEWVLRKEAHLKRTGSSQFWEAEDRYEVLGAIEYMDRLERALDTAESLFNRLRGEDDEPRASYSKVLVQRLAHRLYLLKNAFDGEEEGVPRDAFLVIESSETGSKEKDAQYFAGTLQRMYVQWAESRQMRHKVLQEIRYDQDHIQRFVFAVAGLGAHAVLRHEHGLHVWEEYLEENTYERSKVRVRVVPQPLLPGKTTESLLAQAEELFATTEAVRQITRRYRRDPSPLVRDSVKGWRTGRLDRVLEGNFDLIGE